MRPGYSLLEVLMAVAIIALAAAISIPAILAGFERYERRQAVSQVRAALIDLRTDAVLDGAALTLAEGDPLGDDGALPNGWRVRAATPVAISPAGLCDSARLTLVSPRGRATPLAIAAPDCALSQ